MLVAASCFASRRDLEFAKGRGAAGSGLGYWVVGGSGIRPDCARNSSPAVADLPRRRVSLLTPDVELAKILLNRPTPPAFATSRLAWAVRITGAWS